MKKSEKLRNSYRNGNFFDWLLVWGRIGMRSLVDVKEVEILSGWNFEALRSGFLRSFFSLVLLVSLVGVVVALSGCGGVSDPPFEDDGAYEAGVVSDEDELNVLQGPILEFVNEDGVFGAHGCYSNVNKETGLLTLYLEANEEAGVDYEAYKERIWENFGRGYDIVFELIPFPKEATISGVIRDVFVEESRAGGYVGTILVVSQESSFVAADGEPYYDASQISVNEDVEIVDSQGRVLGFDDLEEGMFVDSFYRGMTLTSYPGLQGTEKLVVHEDYVLPKALDGVSVEAFESLFDGENLSGPFPMVMETWSYEMEIPEWDMDVTWYMDSGMAYYDEAGGFDEPVLYIGNLKYTAMGPDDLYVTGKVEDVVVRPGGSLEVLLQNETYVWIRFETSGEYGSYYEDWYFDQMWEPFGSGFGQENYKWIWNKEYGDLDEEGQVFLTEGHFFVYTKHRLFEFVKEENLFKEILLPVEDFYPYEFEVVEGRLTLGDYEYSWYMDNLVLRELIRFSDYEDLMEYKVGDESYQVHDYREENGSAYFIEMGSNWLYGLVDGHVEVVLDKPVREYGLGQDVLVYTGYIPDQKLIYDNRKLGKAGKITDDGAGDIRIDGEVVYYKNLMDGQYYRFDMVSGELVALADEGED